MAWQAPDFFTAGYAFAGTYGSFYEVKENFIDANDDGTRHISLIQDVIMPPRFRTDSLNVIAKFKNYASTHPGMGYSVENRDQYGYYADRESYFCAVMWSLGLSAYVNNASISTEIRSFTLAQILSYAVDHNLLIAININSLEDVAGTVLRTGDVILCRTNAGKSAEQLYGIGDIYVYDDEHMTGLKWGINGIEETQNIRHPAVIFRPLLERYGLPGMGRAEFDQYITLTETKAKPGNVTITDPDLANIDRTKGASGDGGTIDVATAKKYIWYELMKELNNEYGTAGLMGNIAHESGFKSNNLQNSYSTSLGLTDAEYTSKVDNGTYTNFVNDSAGYGLAQWTYWSRKQKLLDYAKSVGSSIGSLAMQTAYLISELKASYGTVWEQLKIATSVQVACEYVMTKFENPADQSDQAKAKRANTAQTIYNELHGSSFTQTVELNKGKTPNGYNTSIAVNDAAYQASGLLYGPNNQHLSYNTSMLDFSYGMQDIKITSYYAWRNKPATDQAVADGTAGQNSWHNGIDFVPRNSNTWERYTYADCTILETGYNSSMGNYVKYQPDGAEFSITEMHYANNSIPSYVTNGAHLSKGTKIGTMGSTGNSTGAHVHFQINIPVSLPDSSGTNRSTASPLALLRAYLNVE